MSGHCLSVMFRFERHGLKIRMHEVLPDNDARDEAHSAGRNVRRDEHIDAELLAEHLERPDSLCSRKILGDITGLEPGAVLEGIEKLLDGWIVEHHKAIVRPRLW